jgi:hypothetical protein
MDSEARTFYVAVYAAVVSTALLLLRVWEVSIAGGWIKTSTFYHPATNAHPGRVTLTATNKGFGAATVNRLDLMGPGPVRISLKHGDLIVDGPELPLKVEPRTSATWAIDADRLKTRIRENGWHYQVRGLITLATGKQAWESIHRYTDLP